MGTIINPIHDIPPMPEIKLAVVSRGLWTRGKEMEEVRYLAQQAQGGMAK